MWTVSSFFNRMIQRTRYSVNAMGSVTVYTIYLPEGVSKVGTVSDDSLPEGCKRVLDMQ